MERVFKYLQEAKTTRRSFRKDSLRIEAFVVPPLGNNVYVIFEDGSDDAVIIDVAMGSQVILKRLGELELKPSTIVNTHGHSDHTVEDEELRRATGAKLAIHELDTYRLALEDEASRGLGIVKRPIEPDIQLVDNQEIKFGGSSALKVLHTPGHTEGSICLYDEKRGQLFSGDTLFAGGYGRVDGLGADPALITSSLKRILSLPKKTEVYPGHGSFTTVENESWLLDEIQ